MKKILLISLTLFSFTALFAQKNDTVKTEKVKTGLSIGGVPIVAYDEDIGFVYGGLLNLYHYGDGSNYPNYNHLLSLGWTKTTKGGGTTMLSYNALTLIPKTRFKFKLSYATEQAFSFYGFNGYQAYYNHDYEITGGDDYISRMYYRHSKKLFALSVDFQGNIKSKRIRWLAGFTHLRMKIGTVDIDKLNEGQDEDRILPDTALLYDKYVKWGIIPDDQKFGGNVTFFRFGTVYDTRDNEANPTKGIWSDALILASPGFLGSNHGYSKLLLTHRQYITLFPERLSFAYRLSYQTKIAGEIPFYMLPYTTDSRSTNSGLGGASNLRGILRNRVVGEGVAFGNFELRSKFFKTIILNQNFYLGVNAFVDMGMVTSPYHFDTSDVPASELAILQFADESLHIGYGGSICFAINNNFIIAINYGISAKKDDGLKGLYIGLNYLF